MVERVERTELFRLIMCGPYGPYMCPQMPVSCSPAEVPTLNGTPWTAHGAILSSSSAHAQCQSAAKIPSNTSQELASDSGFYEQCWEDPPLSDEGRLEAIGWLQEIQLQTIARPTFSHVSPSLSSP